LNSPKVYKASFIDDIRVNDLVFIEKQHAFVIITPKEALHVELLSLEGEGTLHNDSISPK
jgi:hypothetical protein